MRRDRHNICSLSVQEEAGGQKGRKVLASLQASKQAADNTVDLQFERACWIAV